MCVVVIPLDILDHAARDFAFCASET